MRGHWVGLCVARRAAFALNASNIVISVARNYDIAKLVNICAEGLAP